MKKGQFKQRLCQHCGSMWQPKTKHDPKRKTCSAACAAALLSAVRAGKTLPMEARPGMVETTCPTCGTMTWKPKAWVKKASQSYCSRSCRAKAQTHLLAHSANGLGKKRPGKGMKGPRNPAWKGGVTYRNRHGNYVSVRYVRCPTEFLTMARKDGYVMEHRLVMARWVGRALTRTECVHHVDHDPLHNDRPNLELWPDNRSHKLAEHGYCAIGAANLVSLTA